MATQAAGGTQQIEHPGFGGVDLRDDPVPGRGMAARHVENLVLTGERSVQHRPGTRRWMRAAPDNPSDGLDVFSFASYLGVDDLFWGTKQEGGTGDGTIVPKNIGSALALWWDIARIGTPAVQAVYIALQPATATAIPLLREFNVVTQTLSTPGGTKYDGLVSLGGIANLGRPSVLGVWEAQSRLMLAGFDAGTNGPGGMVVDPDTVVISNPGEPTAYDINGAIRVGAGDGERITAICSWREMTFIFKQSRFWVLSGISVNEASRARYHYRPVEIGGEDGPACPGSVTTAPDGVYYMSRRGLFRTTGNTSRRVNDSIPVGTPPLAFQDIHPTRLFHHDELLYVSVPDEGLWVYDLRRDGWVKWTLDSAQCASIGGWVHMFQRGSLAGGINPYVWTFDMATLLDYALHPENDPVPIDWRWQSMGINFGSARVKRLLGHTVTCGGNMSVDCNLRVYTDYRLGISPLLPVPFVPLSRFDPGETGDGYVRHGYHGREFEIELRGRLDATEWYEGPGLSNLVHHVRGIGGPEAVTKLPGLG